MKQLTTKQAWREIARRIAEGEWEYCGLCHEVNTLEAEGLIDCCTERDMRDEIDYQIVDDEAIWSDDGLAGPWAFEPGDADLRVLAALLLAEACE